MNFERKPKVFGIGFHKTGTKSLAGALRALGYSVHGPDWVHDIDACANLRALYSKALAVVPDYDAFQDNPWPLLWRPLAERFPNARFILTVRDEAQWLESALRYFGAQSTPMRRLIYGNEAGSPVNNETIYIARYRQHNAEVRKAFVGSQRLLELNIAGGESWEPLCDFLGHAVPALPFPHANRG